MWEENPEPFLNDPALLPFGFGSFDSTGTAKTRTGSPLAVGELPQEVLDGLKLSL
ncbi:MAG: hypothetical protein V7K21_26550 [Nostoc sp.]|uniref:hypothetical protein n=1 Tax=Nostoc sp. TaxID=1180 RepID=UPI002FFC843C